MKFDFIIGNPPYQETKGGTKNVDIWPAFIESATKIADIVSVIHPGRWIVPKKQMQPTHNMILGLGLKSFDYYPDASKIFSNVGIDGGVTITNYKKGYSGDIQYYNEGVLFGRYNKNEKFLSNKFEEEVYKKLLLPFGDCKTMNCRILGNPGSLGGSEFGYSKSKNINSLSNTTKGMTNPIKIWANSSYGKGARFSWHYIEKDILSNPPQKLFESRKVMIDKKGHAVTVKSGNIINNIPQIVEVLSTASGDVLFVIPEKDNDYELELIKSMFMTKTVRFLMSITQKDLYVRGFENIPDYTLFIPMLNGTLFTDEWFYTTFNFSEALVNWIETHISPKTDTNSEVLE